MKKLMTFFALISIIILAIPINSYSWLTGFEEGKNDPFQIYYYGQYLPSLRGSNLINEYGAYRNMPTGAYNYAQAQVYGSNQPYNYGWNQPFYVPSFNNYNYPSMGQHLFSGYGTQDYTPSSAEAEHYSSFNNRFTTYADFLPSNIMNMPPMTGDAKYIATPHMIIWSNVVYPNGIPEGPYGTLFGSDPFGNDDDD